MSRFLSRRCRDIDPYVPGEQPRDRAYIKLNTNESPFPPAPGVLEAVTREEVARLNLYSDPAARALEDAIAASYGLSPEQVVAGNGSDEILGFCFQAFCDEHARPWFPDITYGFYRVLSRLNGVRPRIVPLDSAFRVVPSAYFYADGTVFLANPNAPTGLSLSLAEVEQIVKNNPDNLVVLDEAYVDFGGESAVPLLSRYDNLLVVMTYSKSRSLAGGRIGFALGQKALIDDVRKIKHSFNPYSLNRLSLLAGEAAMRDRAYFESCTRAVIQTRERAIQALRARGFTVLDSAGNFVFAFTPKLSGQAFYLALKERGILVRYFDAPRTRDFTRITIGSDAQMEAFLAATDAILEEA